MNITQELENEHLHILNVTELMQGVCKKATCLDKVEYFNIGQEFIHFVEEFSNDFHQIKQQTVLFEEISVPKNHGRQIGSILYSHEQARCALKEIQLAQENADYASFQRAVEEYAEVLQTDINHKNRIFYPLVEENTSDEVKAKINKRYAELETNKQKDDLWDRALSLKNRFSDYLNS